MELKAGDIVMLKSGGQPLTVAEVKGDDVLCIWMGMEGDLFRETLPLATLIQVEEDDEEEDEDDEEEEEDDE
ncbi:YodC family protein [Bradyrhizobium guangdongense]